MAIDNPSPDPAGNRPLVFAHIGDLHLTHPDAHNVSDLRAILAQLGALPHVAHHAALDFVYLPGDLAENGLASEYAILSNVLARPKYPVRLICGDHDRQNGGLEDFSEFFHRLIPASKLPDPDSFYYSETIAGVRCIFLDMCSAGFGSKIHGLDFRLGRKQIDWLSAKVEKAARKGQASIVFAHTYPADLTIAEERAELVGILRAGGVRLVEMGHTHYNEIAHDGVTAFAAARSVGQNEDGSVGYAIAALDGDGFSWRFRALDRTWPFVMITSPADRRLATRAGGADELEVRALVMSDGEIDRCQCRADDGFWIDMHRSGDDRCYSARLPWPAEARRLTVRAFDSRWGPAAPNDFVDTDVIEPASHAWTPPARHGRKPGSDDFRTGPWPQKGVRGDQLGPNRNGRHW